MNLYTSFKNTFYFGQCILHIKKLKRRNQLKHLEANCILIKTAPKIPFKPHQLDETTAFFHFINEGIIMLIHL